MSEHGITLDPPEDYLDARHLTLLIDRWLSTRRVRPSTLIAYRDKIKCFTVWWESEGPARDWHLTRDALQEFELYLSRLPSKRSGEPLTYSSRHAVIRALRMMFKWAARTDRTVRNYGEWVPWPDGATPLRRSVTIEHLQRLMLAATESHMPFRDQAILAFFIGTGCRICEVSTLRVADLQLFADGSGSAAVTGKHTKSNPTGQRLIAFDAVTGGYLIRYMDAKPLTGALWRSQKRGALCQTAIYEVVRRAIRRSGLTEHVRGCHDLRRAFATILGLLYPESPAWADMIRRQLGHQHYTQTAAYTLYEVDDIRERIVTPLALNRE